MTLVLYLLTGINWVEHSERVIGNTQEIGRLVGDKESAVRGYLLTGDDAFLAPYETTKPKLVADIDTLVELVSDNTPQVDRLIRIRALQTQWDKVADALINGRRHQGDIASLVRSGRGSPERAETNRELDAFLNIEQMLHIERVASVKQLTMITVVVFLVLSLTFSVVLAVFGRGRRELLQLSESYGTAIDEHGQQARAAGAGVAARGPDATRRPRGRAAVAGTTVPVDSRFPRRIPESVDGGVLCDRRQGHARTRGELRLRSCAHKLTTVANVPIGYWKVTSALGESAPTVPSNWARCTRSATANGAFWNWWQAISAISSRRRSIANGCNRCWKKRSN